MKWKIVFSVILYIHIIDSRLHQQRGFKKLEDTKTSIQHKRYRQLEQLPDSIISQEELVEDTLKCPEGCLCQFAHFMDLPISRWIQHMQQRQRTTTNEKPKEQSHNIYGEETVEFLSNENEAIYERHDNFMMNPLMKQATCMVQETTDLEKLVSTLPLDLHALILLYTGVVGNKTINSSTFKTLNQLTTLEIRGTPERTLRFVCDEPLSFLQHANFESINILGSENFKRPKITKDPRESFDYKPSVYETYELNEPNEVLPLKNKLDFVTPDDNTDILPYDVYIAEVKRARMPSFYGWDHLEVLRIHGCHLNELHWEMFDNLEALRHLSLERNAIEILPPFAFYGAMHIKTLSLAHNRIHSLHYRSLAGLLELEWLDLSDNQLNVLSERSFPPFPKLEHIDFRMNPLRHIFPATFLVMNKTKIMLFDSKDMALELWSNMPFESLKQMEELSMANVSMASLQQKVFKDLHSLKNLKLRGKVHSIEFDAFADLGELISLDIGYCQLRDISMDAFLGCRKLKILNMSNNNLTYIPPGLFDDQKFLEEIYLQDNGLHTLPTTFFLQPKLRIARLSDNPWKCNCDMVNWRPKITNQERGPTTERCLNDFMSGKRIACRQVENYRIVRKYAPRCTNYNDRSVFYVLRKELKCGGAHVIYTQHSRLHANTHGQRIPLWRKLEQRKRLENEKLLAKQSNEDLNAEQKSNRLVLPTQKHRSLAAQRNTLEWVITSNSNIKPAQRVPNFDIEEEISNEI